MTSLNPVTGDMRDILSHPEQYVIKVPTTSDKIGKKDIIIERQTESLSGGRVYSKDFNENLSAVKAAVEQALKDLPNDDYLKGCQELINKQISQQPSATMTNEPALTEQRDSIITTPLKKKDEEGTSLTMQTPLKAKEDERTPSTDTTSHGKTNEEETIPTLTSLVIKEDEGIENNQCLLNARKLVAQGKIDEAIGMLQKFASETHQNEIPEVVICHAFNIQDDTNHKDDHLKGIETIAQYNEDMMIGEDEDDGFQSDIGNVLALLRSNERGLLLLKKGDVTSEDPEINKDRIFAFRNPVNEQGISDSEKAEVYDSRTKTWKELKEKDLKKFGFSNNDLIINLGKSIDSKFSRGLHFRNETPGPSRVNSHFYHEAQAVDESFCGVHATNDFFGKSMVNVDDYFHFGQEYLKKYFENESHHPIDLAELYKGDASIYDVRTGADPSVLQAYINQQLLQTSKEKLTQETVKDITGGWSASKISKIPQECDRLIVGFGGSHFGALRKDADSNKWYLVDSLDERSQETAYDSIEDALKKTSRGELSDIVTVLYLIKK